jgi:hypothetical protein
LPKAAIGLTRGTHTPEQPEIRPSTPHFSRRRTWVLDKHAGDTKKALRANPKSGKIQSCDKFMNNPG